MAEAKIPDDARNWNALDIYVFCNGQQYTPPRKFHLQSDKLKFWESTLKFLARSQYGSAHSTINLYSIEGKKVEGPLELTNDAAYVAVAPHDCFVQSGYDRYLLKASRSREKRKEKRVNNTNANQDDNGIGIITIKMNNLPKENANALADADKNKGKSNITIKHVLPSRPTSNKTPLTKSPTERRKLNSRNTILRKINNSGKVVNPSQSFKGKNTSAKSLHPVIKESFNYTCKKTTPLTSDTIETVSSPLANSQKQVNNSEEPKKIMSVHKESSRSNTALDVIVEKDDSDNVTHKTVYQNLESDAVSYFVDADLLSKRNMDNLHKSSVISTYYCSEVLNDSKHAVVLPTQSSKQELENRTENNRNAEELTNKINVTSNEQQPNKENKECVINLNLNIELKNCDAHSIKTSKYYCIDTEKQSQTNLQIDLHKDIIEKDDNLNQLNRIKSILDNDCCEGEHKVIIIRCSCSGNNDNDCSFKNLENLKHYIFLPPQNIQIADRQKNEDVKTETGDTRVCSKSDVVKEHKVSISVCSPTVCESHASKMETEARSTITTSSQTDWCNTLVEARCNKDGCYSFHLPSLETLKELKL